MKILQICHKVPYPPSDGGSLAMHQLTKGLQENGADVTVLAINTLKHFIETDKLPLEYISKTQFHAITINTNFNPIKAFFNLFAKTSYNVDRFYSLEFEKQLIALLSRQHFDIIQLEGLYTTVYLPAIRKWSKAKVVLREHNVEFEIWEGLASHETNAIKRKYMNFLARRLKRYELETAASVDAVAHITEEDHADFQRLGINKPSAEIPFGIDVSDYQVKEVVHANVTLFHLGSMDWKPNAESVKWFLDKCWPTLRKKYPSLVFHLAGKNMPSWVFHYKNQNVVVHGFIEDAMEFMNENDIMVVPLQTGSGIRVKIVQGLALGKVIVSTPKGAEGIKFIDRENMMIASSAQDFILAVEDCINSQDLRKRLSGNARKLASEYYDNNVISKKLMDFYKNLVNS